MDSADPSPSPNPDPPVGMGQFYINLLIIGFCLAFFTFDSSLLAATISNRNDTTLPLAYIAMMCMSGLFTTLALCFHYGVYNFLERDTYEKYLTALGREATFIGTFSYLTALYVTVIMTVNRVVIVAKPFSTWFSARRIFLYCAIVSVLLFISLFIPYSSECYVVFKPAQMTFVSGCAPNRHPITTFQNTYAVVVPFLCMLVNLGIILHLRFRRNGTYQWMKNKVTGNNVIIVNHANNNNQSNLSKIQTRREFIMMRQTVSVAIYLSIYELGALLMKVFPDQYAGLPEVVRDGYFYVRLASIPMMNWFIYYVETGSTRRMLRRFWKLNENSVNSAPNATVVTVAAAAPRAGARGNRVATATAHAPVA